MKEAFKPNKDDLVKIGLSVFTLCYWFYAITWVSPESDLRDRILEPTKQTMLFFGLDQNWKLFSPDIRDINYHPLAVITFADGTRVCWQPPQINQKDLWLKFKDEKFRKWSIDSLPWPDYKEFWPDFARFVGRQYQEDGRKPVSLSLLLFWTKIPDPKTNFCPVEKLPKHTSPSLVFYYLYQPGDLK